MTAAAFSIADPRYHDLVPVLLAELRAGKDLHAESTAQAIVYQAEAAGISIDVDAVLHEARQSINKTDKAREKINGYDETLVIMDGIPAVVTMTEDNIALVFARQFAGKLLFDHTSGRWLQWDGARWKPEPTRLAYHFARMLTRGLNTDGKARWAKAAVFGAVETIARSDRAFACTLDQFDADPWKLGTPAGIVDLKSGLMLPAGPAAMITRITGVAPAPGDPVRWIKFLQEATGNDAEVIDFLQRLCGYCLTGTTSSQVLTFIYGPGGNGKGVFINVVGRILGDYAQVADMRTFTAGKHDRHPTELAALRGARLVTASETEQTAEWAESRIKQLTGTDKVRARFMRQDEFEFLPQFKLVIIGNHRPRLRVVDDAIRRRLRIVPFEFRPEVVNPNLEEELFAEAGQILGWMLEGCLRWQKDRLPLPAAVQAATDDYFDSQDTFNDWISTACESGRKSCEKSSALFKSWSDYCKATGDDPGSQVRFAEELKRRGLRKETTMIGKVWYGIRLRAVENPPPEWTK